MGGNVTVVFDRTQFEVTVIVYDRYRGLQQSLSHPSRSPRSRMGAGHSVRLRFENQTAENAEVTVKW